MSKPDNIKPQDDGTTILSIFIDELKKMAKDAKNVEGCLEVTDSDTKKKIDLDFKISQANEIIDSQHTPMMTMSSQHGIMNSEIKIEFKPYIQLNYIIAIQGVLSSRN